MTNDDVPPIQVNKGGPNVLEEPCNENRSLFLCYPDDFEGETESLGLRCLHAYEGDVVRGGCFIGVADRQVSLGVPDAASSECFRNLMMVTALSRVAVKSGLCRQIAHGHSKRLS